MMIICTKLDFSLLDHSLYHLHLLYIHHEQESTSFAARRTRSKFRIKLDRITLCFNKNFIGLRAGHVKVFESKGFILLPKHCSPHVGWPAVDVVPRRRNGCTLTLRFWAWIPSPIIRVTGWAVQWRGRVRRGCPAAADGLAKKNGAPARCHGRIRFVQLVN